MFVGDLFSSKKFIIKFSYSWGLNFPIRLVQTRFFGISLFISIAIL